jgi:hypothetical protein
MILSLFERNFFKGKNKNIILPCYEKKMLMATVIFINKIKRFLPLAGV